MMGFFIFIVLFRKFHSQKKFIDKYKNCSINFHIFFGHYNLGCRDFLNLNATVGFLGILFNTFDQIKINCVKFN